MASRTQSRRQTRPENATKHVGEPDKPAPRRSQAEIKAARIKKADERRAQIAENNQKIADIAAIEDEIRDQTFVRRTTRQTRSTSGNGAVQQTTGNRRLEVSAPNKSRPAASSDTAPLTPVAKKTAKRSSGKRKRSKPVDDNELVDTAPAGLSPFCDDELPPSQPRVPMDLPSASDLGSSSSELSELEETPRPLKKKLKVALSQKPSGSIRAAVNDIRTQKLLDYQEPLASAEFNRALTSLSAEAPRTLNTPATPFRAPKPALARKKVRNPQDDLENIDANSEAAALLLGNMPTIKIERVAEGRRREDKHTERDGKTTSKKDDTSSDKKDGNKKDKSNGKKGGNKKGKGKASSAPHDDSEDLMEVDNNNIVHRNIANVQRAVVVVEDDDDDNMPSDYSGDGYVETSEEEEEGKAASSSPPKKQPVRLTSKSLIKIDDDESYRGIPKKAAKSAQAKGSRLEAGRSNQQAIDVDTTGDSAGRTGKSVKPSSRVSYKNADLPNGAHHNNTWKAVVLPTLVKYMGTRINPWSVSDREFLSVLQQIWDLAYGNNLKHKVVLGDSVHGLASQRIYEWRNMFGSTAIRAFELYFKTFDGGKAFSDLRTRKTFGQNVMIDAGVLYKSHGVQSHKGLYRSDFVLASLRIHIDTIEGALSVPGLYEQPLDAYPYGAVGLAAAAACRAAKLYGTGKIAYTQPNDKIMILKNTNILSGKESKETDFSIANYGEATKQAAMRCQSLSWAKLQTIYHEAMGFKAASVPHTSRTGDDMNIDIHFADLKDDDDDDDD